MSKPESLEEPLQPDKDNVSYEDLKSINDALLSYPTGFEVLKNSIKY